MNTEELIIAREKALIQSFPDEKVTGAEFRAGSHITVYWKDTEERDYGYLFELDGMCDDNIADFFVHYLTRMVQIKEFGFTCWIC